MKVVHDQERHRVAAYADGGEEIGHLEYSRHEGTLSANHTWTDEAERGHGVAAAMLDALVGYARDNHLRIIPVCPYVKAAFKKAPERFAPVI